MTTKTEFHKLAGRESGLMFMLEDSIKEHEENGWEVRQIIELPADRIAVVYYWPDERIDA